MTSSGSLIRAVIFDCFGVLQVDASRIFYESLEGISSEQRRSLYDLNRQSDYGLISHTEWCKQVAEVIDKDSEYVMANIQRENVRNTPLVEYMAELRRRGYKIGMVSNIGTGAIDRFFSREERERLFDAVVLSGEEMTAKPSIEIFEIAAERLGVSPGECLMIDDIRENCDGADAAGMEAILHQSNSQTVAAAEEALKRGYA